MTVFSDKKITGYVFNVQLFSVHDGPGIRTLVFLKGCPLRCLWCSNPESQSPRPELAFNKNKCIGTAECERCLAACQPRAISKKDDKIEINREICTNCLQCAEVCPSKALNIYGKLMTVEEVLKAAEEDSVFYNRSGGGITLSGGEPLFQPEFTLAILSEAKRRGLDTAMETCGFASWEHLDKACAFLDTLIYDIKSLDEVKHKKFTGVANELILMNFQEVIKNHPQLKILVRTPVVPGFNDNVAEIKAIHEYIKGLPNVTYEPLAYHRMGQPKYAYLGREYFYGDTKLDDGVMAKIKEALADIS